MKKILPEAAMYAFILVLCLVILSLTFRLREVDISVPLRYFGDGVFMSALFKGVIENGWYLENPYLGMPAVSQTYDFPFTDAISFLVVKFLALFFSDYAIVFNLFILLGYFLTAITALSVFRHFKISFVPAIVCSLLFSFSPYHIMRGMGHVFLGFYVMIPLAIMVVVWVFSREDLLFSYDSTKEKQIVNLKSRIFWIAVLICLGIASSGIYYAFFTCFFLVVAGICSFLIDKRHNFFNALILIAVITSGVLVNVAPNLLYQEKHGNNIVKRSDLESELYGLKITQLLLPANYHRISRFSEFTQHYSKSAPVINENSFATLGVIGGVGFLFLIGWVVFYRRLAVSETIEYLSVLNLSAVLLATIGGFASLLTYLTHFQIRGYNRISIFIAFLSLLAVGFLFEKWREKWSANQFKRVAFYILMGVILVAGLLDQTPEPNTPNSDKVKYLQDKQFIKSIEANLPKNTMVFQLPYIPFPEHPAVYKMTDYEHLKGYLHSTYLRWSYGAPRGREGDLWQKQIATKSPEELIKIIISTGFGGLWLDRFGYTDNGVQMVSEFNSVIGYSPIESKDQRYVFWDLSSLKNSFSLDEMKKKSTQTLLSPAFITPAIK